MNSSTDKASQTVNRTGNRKKSNLVAQKLKKNASFLKPKPFLPTLPSLLSRPSIPLIHRDISWLQFNERVLEQARPTSQNLPIERVKFLAISASNLDEFFMIRMAALDRDILLHGLQSSKGRHLERIRNVILENVLKFGARQSEILELLSSELSRIGVHLVLKPKPGKRHYQWGRQIFEKHILGHLQAPATFEFQSLKQLDNLSMAVVFPDGLWMRVPPTIPHVFCVRPPKTDSVYFFYLDQLIRTYLSETFKGHSAPALLRITRDADVTTELIEEGTVPTPDVIRNCLTTRDRGRPVRLQYLGGLSTDFMERCSKDLGLIPTQIFPTPASLCLRGLWKVIDEFADQSKKKNKRILYPPLPSYVPKHFRHPKEIFKQLRERDFLLHHPYDSFEAFLEWIRSACQDSKTRTVEITVYRIGTLSPIVEILKKAAKKIRVRIIVELRARFDEGNNLKLAEELASAGCDVHFGFGKLKLHAKIALVTKKENKKEVRYTHLSTGNYNAKTARQYTDLAIFTSNPDIGNDARCFFDAVYKGELPQGFTKLVLAPTRLHRRLLSLIQSEIQAAMKGKPARIVAKTNALVDEQVIAHLYRASQLGVKIDLIVRGACSLIPKVDGLSKNIRVISIVDRFLEHSRIYYFESSNQMYLSSADWMPRNFFRRLEVAFPVLDPHIFSYIKDVVLPTHLGDTTKARELTPQGTWKKTVPKTGQPHLRAQFLFAELAANRYKGTPLV